MSRIHEALKKAEQERAISQPAPASETPSTVLETPADSAAVIASATVLAGAAPAIGLNTEGLMARSRTTQWAPDPKVMLFFGTDEHASGMEEFRTLRTRLYQTREKITL